jgi:hypothetical protein
VDFLIFADVVMDSRVFALSHVRLCKWQAALWGWGGTSGIPTIDFYFAPEALWKYSACPLPGDKSTTPQTLFSEQVNYLFILFTFFSCYFIYSIII